MITRRRGHSDNTAVEEHTSNCPFEIEVPDFVETIHFKTSPYEDMSSENGDSTVGLELDGLFGIDKLDWTYEKDAVSPLFDIGLTELGVGDTTDQDFGIGTSRTPSPEGMSAGQKRKRRENLSGRIINKNAIAARMNRLKKKEYVNGLENKVGSLSSENHILKQENVQLNKRVEELEDESRYLRAVLANESMLAQLLSRLSGVNGMKLSSSLFQESNKNEDHDYALPRKLVKTEKETSGGVCLHVDKNHVSVEFCTKCAESASASFKIFLLGDDCSTMLDEWVQNIPVCLAPCGFCCRKLKRWISLLPTWPVIFLKVV
ncbi:CREB/ATF bZIP transcription factor isoform X1 [Oncorhynchus keta]|uniref:CREB/ATF bZIP transcription factor isoform X1 n=1 Tax=Oncorhynchus keta TaxID=8018 RepID=UPI0015F7A9C6|nr:CREB/ATF bZIP transcription factor isoform X1 [Oncorhynchus keta]XP_035637578.1 CREB/ATF bZIP transcription factor isoform X1 [Oncorhynchus keta]